MSVPPWCRLALAAPLTLLLAGCRCGLNPLGTVDESLDPTAPRWSNSRGLFGGDHLNFFIDPNDPRIVFTNSEDNSGVWVSLTGAEATGDLNDPAWQHTSLSDNYTQVAGLVRGDETFVFSVDHNGTQVHTLSYRRGEDPVALPWRVATAVPGKRAGFSGSEMKIIAKGDRVAVWSSLVNKEDKKVDYLIYESRDFGATWSAVRFDLRGFPSATFDSASGLSVDGLELDGDGWVFIARFAEANRVANAVVSYQNGVWENLSGTLPICSMTLEQCLDEMSGERRIHAFALSASKQHLAWFAGSRGHRSLAFGTLVAGVYQWREGDLTLEDGTIIPAEDISVTRDLAFAPDDEATVFFSVRSADVQAGLLGYSLRGYYKSTNGGLTWRRVLAADNGCRELSLLAFSCKGRGFCPSCTTRRAVETALRLEAQLPEVAHRQWTLSLPRGLRLAVAKRPALLKLVEKALVHAVWRWQRASAKRLGVTGKLQGAAQAFPQWFGSNLQMTPHLHVLVPEAQWRAEGEVVELPPPDDEDVESVLMRLLRQLRAVLAEVEGALPEDEYEGLQQEALQGQLQLPGEARAKKRRVAVRAGFSLHADTAVGGRDREGLSRLCRYAARGPVAESRVRRLPDGRYEYTTKHGVSLVMTAEALVKRLVALVPPARLHLSSGHGVYAANAALRSVVLRQEPVPAQQPEEAPPAATQPPLSPGPEQEKPKRRPKLDWATLQARTFGEDVWKCGRCGGRRRIVAVVTSHRTAEEVLQNLGLLPQRRLLPPEPGPPQLELAM